MRRVAFVAERFGLPRVLSVIPPTWPRGASLSEARLSLGCHVGSMAETLRSIGPDNSERNPTVVRRNRAQPALPSRADHSAHGRLPVWAALPEGCRRTDRCDGVVRRSEGAEGVWRGSSSHAGWSGVVRGHASRWTVLPRDVRRLVGFVHLRKEPGVRASCSCGLVSAVQFVRSRSCVARSNPASSLSRLALCQACVGIGANVQFGSLRHVLRAIGVFEGFGPREFR